MPHFFIERPVFAWVVSIFIILFGGLTLARLPVELYPDIAPPAVTVYATYPGATPQTLNDSVIEPLEREISSVDDLLYFESMADSTGTAQITVTFKPGTDYQMAQVQVQNKVAAIEPRLPQMVRTIGLQINASSSTNLMIVQVVSSDPNVTGVQLGDFFARSVIEDLKRIDGVGRVQQFGSSQALRIWVDPVKLTAHGVTVDEIANAIRVQNAQVSPGQIGAAPIVEGQKITVPVVVQGQLESVEEFENLVVRANQDGSRILLGDLADIALGAENYTAEGRLNGRASAAAGVQLSPGANAVAVANAVHEKLEELSASFPDHITYNVPFDSAPYVMVSMSKVMTTFVEALLLVFLIMYLFMQNLRATFIPAIVAPIALLGTFAVMYIAGFSVNVLTMFGMVLAIGIIVDDAIVVVENVERIMAEEGLSPKEATKKAMTEITGAVIGITLVLTAVFVPIAMATGAIGTIYRQFSLSMAVSILFSAFLALSLTPALCATMLKPLPPNHHEKKGFFGWFNRGFDKLTNGYTNAVGGILKRGFRTFIVYAAMIAAVVLMFNRLPSSFLPEEDKGQWMTSFQLPSDATVERTEEVLNDYRDFVLSRENVKDVITIRGFGFAGSGPNVGMAFTVMEDWPDRTKGATVFDEVDAVRARFANSTVATVTPVVPPSISTLGNSAGFSMRLIDRQNQGNDAFMAAQGRVLGAAFASEVVQFAYPEGLGSGPMIDLKIDRETAEALGVSFASINATLSAALGSLYVNDFSNAGRQQRVIIQALPESRMQIDDILGLPVGARDGSMVPLSSVAQAEWTMNPLQLVRYNGYPALRFGGRANPGFASGEAMLEMERIVAEVAPEYTVEWTGLSYQERLSGDEAPLLLLLSLIVVVLVLAALYESWSIPFAVILVVPLGVIGALAAVLWRGIPNDIFFKVGLITLIGLSAKNAILIVEFAKQLEEEGWETFEAAKEAARLRLRPILMTSLAFGLGVTPLVLSSGAAAVTQHHLGTGVLGGMVTGTVFAVLFVPSFYLLVRGVAKKFSKDKDEPAQRSKTEPMTPIVESPPSEA